jgi:hypothetical protein
LRTETEEVLDLTESVGLGGADRGEPGVSGTGLRLGGTGLEFGA